MMFVLHADDLKTLLHHASGPAVSIYIPTEREPNQLNLNRIRLKNQLDAAEARLDQLGVARKEVTRLLAPGRALIANGRYTPERSDGLALFLAPDFVRIFPLPLDFSEQCVVGERFAVKPLLPLFAGNGRFYILALSQKMVRLLYASQYAVQEMTLKNVPLSLVEALQYDDPERQIQFHSGTGSTPRAQAAIFHGHGVGSNESLKEDLLRFFQLVDKGISRRLASERAPLILFGVDYLHPIYREANSYQHLLDEGVTGSPDQLRADELHAQAWPLAARHFKQIEADALAHFARLSGTAQVATDLESVVAAAAYARVDTLFLPHEEEAWGRFEPESGQIVRHSAGHLACVDLYELAAEETLRNGGRVYLLPPEEVPGDGPLAAILRF